MVNGVDFIPERDMELYEAYRRALKMREVKSHREAVMRAISSHACRFLISTLQAYRGILLIRKGKTKEKGRSIRNKMIDDIYEIYKELEKKREFKGSSVYFITSFAVYQTAPCFYISYSRALAIIQRINRERKNGR